MIDVDYVLDYLDQQGTFNARNMKTLRKHKSALEEILKEAESEGKFPSDSNHKDAFIQEACNFLLEVSSFIFKEALTDFNVSDTEVSTFYKNRWLTTVTIGKDCNFSLIMKDLYVICASPDYLDLSYNKSAYDVMQNCCDQEVYSNIMKIAIAMKIPFSSNCAPITKIDDYTDAFRKIPKASDFIRNHVLAKEFEHIRSLYFPELFSILWEGKCSIQISIDDEAMPFISELKQMLNENGFDLDNKNSIVLRCMEGKNLNQYNTEESILEYLKCNDVNGYELFAIAHSCKTTLFYNLSQTVVNDLLELLQNVRVKDKNVVLQKVSTHLPVYKYLIENLDAKGFKVDNLSDRLVISW